MKTVIFNTVKAMVKFDQKEIKEFLICKGSEYDLDEVAKLLCSNQGQSLNSE